MNHDLATCFCDACITLRKRQEIELREAAKQADAYIKRRGGEPKRGELQDALKDRSSSNG